MAKFKVIKEFVLNGHVQKLDAVIELDHKMSSLKSIQGNIEKYIPGQLTPPPVPVSVPADQSPPIPVPPPATVEPVVPPTVPDSEIPVASPPVEPAL